MEFLSQGEATQTFQDQESFLSGVDNFALAGLLHEAKKNPSTYLQGIYLLQQENKYYVARTVRTGRIGDMEFRADIVPLEGSAYSLDDFVTIKGQVTD